MVRNYQQAKIYCIKVNTEEEYLSYIGSSCKRLLSQRMNQHRQNFNKWKKNPEKYNFVSSFTLFEKYGIENCFIELIELFPCSCNDELRKKEREHIEKQECVNIIKKPIRTMEEKIEDDKICKRNHDKIHKKKIAEKRKETFDCPCGSVCRKHEKARHERSKKHQYYLSTIGTLCSTTVTETS